MAILWRLKRSLGGRRELDLMQAKDLGLGAIFQARTVATVINEALVRSRL